MMLPSGPEHLLLPVRKRFIALTIVLAVWVQVFLLVWAGRERPWLPDVLAVVLVFWITYQPRLVGMGWFFLLGLLMDVFHYGMLGQTALSYTLMAYLALHLQRRILHFNSWQQTLHIVLVFVPAALLHAILGRIGSGLAPHWSIILAPILQTLLWPMAAWLLLAPQRRPPNPDLHRPL